jgi:chromosome segregation ATPase
VSSDDPQRTHEWEPPPADVEAPAEARSAELRAELAETDARRAEEETGKAHEAVEEAREREEKLSRKEHELKERAEKAEAEAADARGHAEQTTATPSASGAYQFGGARAAVAQSALERPEVRAGLAFGGAFLVARILKRIFD